MMAMNGPQNVFFGITTLLTLMFFSQGYAQFTPEISDLNDDGVVNILDFSILGSSFGAQAGTGSYRDGLDLNPDGTINMEDINPLIPLFGVSGIANDPTQFLGRVFDGLGNPLPGVTVEVSKNGQVVASGQSNQDGAYQFQIPAGGTGFTTVTFIGATASDPSPGGSGQYPTIPDKPIFINGGTDNVFRDMSLPERDLTGAMTLDDSNSVSVGQNARMLTEDVTVQNAGVMLSVPSGCMATFPDGEPTQLSITRVDPSMLPVPMPPGLSSSLFVTYQPGSTEVECSGGQEIFTEFDNTDGFPNGPGNLTDGPFLAGIENGVFTPLVACEVSGATEGPSGVFTGGTVRCGPIPLPFDFAWYHTDIRPDLPCPRTTVVGTVRLNNASMDPIAGASVSVPGTAPVTTGADGSFSIPNVPAGPNGTRCFSNPFTIRASASKDLDDNGTLSSNEFGASSLTPAVPGELTDVGDIKLALSGMVRGVVRKLSSIDPFIVISLPNTNISVNPQAAGAPTQNTTTDGSGNYTVNDLPAGGYTVTADFEGILPLPGGGTAQKTFFGSQDGSIDFDGDLDVVDFRFTSEGSVKVIVQDSSGNLISDALVQVESFGGDVGSGFVAPAGFLSGETNAQGMTTIDGVQMGACEVTAQVFENGEVVVAEGTAGLGDGCFINQHGEQIELTVVVQGGGGPVVPDIRGTYTGVAMGTTSNCEDPVDDGPFQDQVTVEIPTQFGPTFSVVLFDNDPDPGDEFVIEATGTIAFDGSFLSTNCAFTEVDEGQVDNTGICTFSGTLSGDTLTFGFAADSTAGDTCSTQGMFEGTRSPF